MGYPALNRSQSVRTLWFHGYRVLHTDSCPRPAPESCRASQGAVTPSPLGRELLVLPEVKQCENTSLGGVVLSEQEVGTLLGPAKS